MSVGHCCPNVTRAHCRATILQWDHGPHCRATVALAMWVAYLPGETLQADRHGRAHNVFFAHARAHYQRQ
jgi:hypothetical protein